MKLVYKFKSNNEDINNELRKMCRISKDIYNQALYIMKQKTDNKEYPSYFELNMIMSKVLDTNGVSNYHLLKTMVSQQTIGYVSKNVYQFFKDIRAWKKDKSKFGGMPRFPRYLKKDGYFLLCYPNLACSIRRGKLMLKRNFEIEIPQYEKYVECFKNFNQVRVIPKNNGREFEIEIVYESETVSESVDVNRVASIDLGVDNLVTLVSDCGVIIYSGKQIKAINQYRCKRVARLMSLFDKENRKEDNRTKYETKQILKIVGERKYVLKDLIHKVSRHIVNYLVKNGIGTLVVGYNNDWKDSRVLNKNSSQTFFYIPFSWLVWMLRYKCALVGIKFIDTNESYTSKTDALAFEEICKHESYLGKRIKRGLFKSSVGKLINADVNGSINIMRKVVGDSSYVKKIIDSGFLFNPVKLHDLFSLNYAGL